MQVLTSNIIVLRVANVVLTHCGDVARVLDVLVSVMCGNHLALRLLTGGVVEVVHVKGRACQ